MSSSSNKTFEEREIERTREQAKKDEQQLQDFYRVLRETQAAEKKAADEKEKQRQKDVEAKAELLSPTQLREINEKLNLAFRLNTGRPGASWIQIGSSFRSPWIYPTSSNVRPTFDKCEEIILKPEYRQSKSMSRYTITVGNVTEFEKIIAPKILERQTKLLKINQSELAQAQEQVTKLTAEAQKLRQIIEDTNKIAIRSTVADSPAPSTLRYLVSTPERPPSPARLFSNSEEKHEVTRAAEAPKILLDSNSFHLR